MQSHRVVCLWRPVVLSAHGSPSILPDVQGEYEDNLLQAQYDGRGRLGRSLLHDVDFGADAERRNRHRVPVQPLGERFSIVLARR